MKPSQVRAVLWLVPMAIYVAMLGWKFGLGLIGFIGLSYVTQHIVRKMVPDQKQRQ